MTIERHNPAGLHPTPGYHHVTVVQARRTIHLAGQCPVAPDGTVVAGDVLDQVDQVVANIAIALKSAGATPSDVVRTVIYVVTSDRSTLSAVWDRLLASEIAAALSTASTLVGVTRLGFPDQLVEVDVTAAL